MVNAALAASEGLGKASDEDEEREDDDDDLDNEDFDDFRNKVEEYRPDYKAITGQSMKMQSSGAPRQTTTGDEIAI